MVSISSFQNHHTTAPLCSLLDGEEREGEGDHERGRKREKRSKKKSMETKQKEPLKKSERYHLLSTF